MRIIIVGDGKVGYTLAKELSQEHDITIIDNDEAALRKADERLDVLCVKGNGMRGTVLLEAGVPHCDILIAATSRDEMNMLCCLMAKKLGAKYTVARIRGIEYANDLATIRDELDIDMVINPEQSTAREISRMLRFPGAVNIETFVRGRVEMVGFVADDEDSVVAVKLASLRKRISADILFCACERNGTVFIPRGDTVFTPGDKIYVIGESMDITHFFKSIGRNTNRVKNTLLIGGGRIAQYLAGFLIGSGVKTKIIEINTETCVSLTEEFPEATIINADGTDIDLLEAEGFRSVDAIITLTNSDEDNIMTALLALQYEIPRVIAKSNRQNYNSVAHQFGLDCIVSPKLITAGQIIHLVCGMQNSEGSNMETLYRIVGDQASAIEFTVDRGMTNVGVPLKMLRIKSGILIAIIVRRGHVIIPDGNSVFELSDSVVLIVCDEEINRLTDIFEE